jgi:allantoinase
MAELTSWNPARRFGLRTKGDIAEGFDADIVCIDPNKSFVVNSGVSPSTQGYSVFEGHSFEGPVTATFLRGNLIYENGTIIGDAKGNYLNRWNEK